MILTLTDIQKGMSEYEENKCNAIGRSDVGNDNQAVRGMDNRKTGKFSETS